MSGIKKLKRLLESNKKRVEDLGWKDKELLKSIYHIVSTGGDPSVDFDRADKAGIPFYMQNAILKAAKDKVGFNVALSGLKNRSDY